MTRLEVNALETIVMGYSFQMAVINKAIKESDSSEVTVCLKDLKECRLSYESIVTLESFVRRLRAQGKK